MSLFANINQYILPADLLIEMLNVYRSLGKNLIYHDKLVNHQKLMLDQTIERDTYFLALLLGLEINDNRMRLLVTKNSGPRTKEERIVAKIKDVLRTIQNDAPHYTFNASDILSYINRIYGKNHAQYNTELLIPKEKASSKIKRENLKSRRFHFDQVIEEYQRMIEKNQYEHILLSVVLIIEMANLSPYTSENELGFLLALYYMMLRCQVDCFHYVSFFEYLYQGYAEFKRELMSTSINYYDGFLQPSGLVRFIFNFIQKAYQKLDQIIREYHYEEKFNKGDNVENTIYKLPNLFTKADIKIYHPYISESTINRALNKLKSENKIRPLGKGRSAHWIKIEEEDEQELKRYFR